MTPKAASQAQEPQYAEGSMHQEQLPCDQVSTQRIACRQKVIPSDKLSEGMGRAALAD